MTFRGTVGVLIRAAGCLTGEQRRQAGCIIKYYIERRCISIYYVERRCIGSLKCEVIFKRALSAGFNRLENRFRIRMIRRILCMMAIYDLTLCIYNENTRKLTDITLGQSHGVSLRHG